ncbi:hypothetical protein I8J29_05875 [Paenibacillus sp. MWE-103]|uniref:Uncharacterized protein n=1 Tax=Paenibacillus artemisiicola TaxID=1172618 RepID=A0ABS3W5Z5_9BACL|nr:hypothetical protein [Paenibacillus artemisiicola]MBO7743716.1 hypothetical protein [Paenibacillus artemisiicola]
MDILVRSAKAQPPASMDVFDQVNDQPQEAKKDTLAKAAELSNLLIGKLTGGATGIALPAKPKGELKLFFGENSIADLWLAITWNA